MSESIDHSAVIFGNTLSKRDYAKACRTKQKFARRFGDDSADPCPVVASPAPAVGTTLGVQRLAPAPAGAVSAEGELALPENAVIIGTIRMGFGHYRIAMALASAAHALGYSPYWLDLCGFPATTATKIVNAQNSLYSLGSRLSQQFGLFNRLVWEPMNSEGFRRLSYNAADQKTAELMVAPYASLPRSVPVVAAHAWPAQAAVHAGFTRVVNCIPDNWPMALHLAEGAIHTVQTPSAYWGYKMLRGFAGKQPLRPMPANALVQTGHYVDHELVQNIPADCARRTARAEAGKPIRYLLPVGGAGAQQGLIREIVQHLLPAVEAGRATLWLNMGDHEDVWQALVRDVPALSAATCHFNNFAEVETFAQTALAEDSAACDGLHAFCDTDIFAAVYSTNVLMRAADVLATKPSELAYYPVPKLMLPRVGGHEAWGAVRAAELGDGTYEMETPAQVCAMIDALQAEPELIAMMCANIQTEHARGTYNGAYRAIEQAIPTP